ncbi:MAG: hypothetical protein ACLVEX_11115 [Ruthenibacterium lactatiformans]
MLEPVYPVAFEDIVSLYRAVDRHKLQAHRSEIISLFRQNKALVERATRYITAAGSLLQDSMRVALSCTDTAKARAFAGTLSRRYISSSGEAPHEEIRLLSALTLQGIIFYSNTIAKLADTIVVLDDEYGAASRTLLYALRGGGAAKRTQHRNLLLFHEPIRKNRASVHSPHCVFALSPATHIIRYSFPANAPSTAHASATRKG